MRIRTVKPEFFLHEGLYDLEKSSGFPIRVAFEGLWSAADREGRFRWEPRKLKSQILPYDDLDFSTVLNLLASSGFIQKYVFGEAVCGFIPSFKKHQHVNVREAESTLPDPSSGVCTCIHVQDFRPVNIPEEIRKLVFDRHGPKCCRCQSENDLTIDHILPQSMGGNHNPKNLRVMCRKCNSARPVAGDKFLKDIEADGFTLDYLHGICMHVYARASTNPARVPSLPVPVPKGESEGKAKRLHGIPSTVDEVITYGKTVPPPDGPIPENRCRAFWQHYEGQARTSPGGDVFWITSGDAVVTNWKIKLPSFKEQLGGKGNANNRQSGQQGISASRGTSNEGTAAGYIGAAERTQRRMAQDNGTVQNSERARPGTDATGGNAIREGHSNPKV